MNIRNSKFPQNYFFCPASDYLNQYNETGSHGQISYQFIKHLSRKTGVKNIFGAVIKTLPVEKIEKTTIEPLIKESQNASLSDFDSLYFYLISFFRFFKSPYYRNSDVVHHIIPFALGRSFNLFFHFKDKKKKYIIGPIIGPHVNTDITADEEYSFNENQPLLFRIKMGILELTKNILLVIFGSTLKFLSIRTIQQADIVLFSDNHAMNYHKKYLKLKQKAYILDTGIDTEIFKPKKQFVNTREKDDTLKVLFVGRLTKRKGCEYLIRAVDEAVKIKKNISIDCRIHGIGPLKEELEALVEELGIAKHVTFLGGVKSNEEIAKRYHDVDIVCLPALSETFTVTKEAMCSGKPVIVTDVCSNAERVTPGTNGFVVPPKDVKAIAKILVELSNEPELIGYLSKNAAKSRELYDWDNIIDRYLNFICK